jgi:hypothetical protein
MSDTLTTRLTGHDREQERNRLAVIASCLQACFREERELSARIQRLRNEQAELNAKVYRA